jgi:hypothetical protein
MENDKKSLDVMVSELKLNLIEEENKNFNLFIELDELKQVKLCFILKK